MEIYKQKLTEFVAAYDKNTVDYEVFDDELRWSIAWVQGMVHNS